jgi:haloalkane dehalogenase
MEAIVTPLRHTDFADRGEFLDRVRGPEGEHLVLQDNVFIEGFLPAGVLRDLEPEEMEAYRSPWREAGERRRPMLSGPAMFRSTVSQPTWSRSSRRIANGWPEALCPSC